jgi:UDP-N-acetylmuramate: L-alanyl-gamma-D-glutamyl-meso-diaminopimelate ligase
VAATIKAVKAQFPERNLIGVLELHTYSSLNEDFMKEFKGAMDDADEAVVFYSNHALELKRLPLLPKEAVQKGFNKKDLFVFNQKEELEAWLQNSTFDNSVLLLMSSGNYDGMDVETLSKRVTLQAV